jgi:hypothetical protein
MRGVYQGARKDNLLHLLERGFVSGQKDWASNTPLEHIDPNIFNHLQTFFSVSWGGMRLSPLGTSATVDLFYQPRML